MGFGMGFFKYEEWKDKMKDQPSKLEISIYLPGSSVISTSKKSIRLSSEGKLKDLRCFKKLYHRTVITHMFPGLLPVFLARE